MFFRQTRRASRAKQAPKRNGRSRLSRRCRQATCILASRVAKAAGGGGSTFGRRVDEQEKCARYRRRVGRGFGDVDRIVSTVNIRGRRRLVFNYYKPLQIDDQEAAGAQADKLARRPRSHHKKAFDAAASLHELARWSCAREKEDCRDAAAAATSISPIYLFCVRLYS